MQVLTARRLWDEVHLSVDPNGGLLVRAVEARKASLRRGTRVRETTFTLARDEVDRLRRRLLIKRQADEQSYGDIREGRVSTRDTRNANRKLELLAAKFGEALAIVEFSWEEVEGMLLPLLERAATPGRRTQEILRDDVPPSRRPEDIVPLAEERREQADQYVRDVGNTKETKVATKTRRPAPLKKNGRALKRGTMMYAYDEARKDVVVVSVDQEAGTAVVKSIKSWDYAGDKQVRTYGKPRTISLRTLLKLYA